MAIWKSNTALRQRPAPATEVSESRVDSPLKLGPATGLAAASLTRTDTSRRYEESRIAADIVIEGKIDGGGSVSIAGRFKGNVTLQGDLTIEAGAKLTGSVRADTVTIAGELEGNVAEASHVDLAATAVVLGDLKAGSLTVAAGARMRGQVEFGWDDGKGPKPAKLGFEHSMGDSAA